MRSWILIDFLCLAGKKNEGYGILDGIKKI